MGVDRSIKFVECQVFINVARLIDILKEYIYIYHLKKCTDQKKNLELHV